MTSMNAAPIEGTYASTKRTTDFLTIMIAGQRFGIPILQVQDVLGSHTITRIPLAPAEVAGSLNLRGRIVTAINMCNRLGVTDGGPDEHKKTGMSVVVEHENELYSLIIDKIGDVMTLRDRHLEVTPATLDPVWREISSGIYRLDGEILVVLDIPKFLNTVHM